jgi:tRNA (guanine37-N1)-methyltransferase
MLTFHVVSIFPKMVEEYCNESILKKAKEKGLVDFKFYNIRDYTKDKHNKVDDKPYGGGPGMVMNAQPILDCVESIKQKIIEGKSLSEGEGFRVRRTKVVIFVPSAPKWTNETAKKYSKKYTDIILICGRYEGIDYRVQKILKAESVSVGDFVLTGGEIPAMILIDSISRQVKGVLGDFNSLEESRKNVLGQVDEGIEEFYTRPEILEWKGKKHKVPKVFLSGNPKLIKEYKQARKS